ncbi:MAG: hypothetical protein BWY77_01154 [bacterium ADurb.Bin431]|nr:MAG: hypothetical protein BWY77_01154 [bacterium ADurb.Bin431]
MVDRNVELGGGQGSRQGRVGIAINQHPVGFLLLQHPLDPDQHLGGLLAVRAGTDLEIEVGRGDLQLLEKKLRHVAVIVLTGVQ